VKRRLANPNEGDRQTGETALHAAARSGRHVTVQALVEECGAKPELTDNNGETALVIACSEKHEDTAMLLVASTKGADALDVQGNQDTLL
jgi:ankyrin repeat protein